MAFIECRNKEVIEINLRIGLEEKVTESRNNSFSLRILNWLEIYRSWTKKFTQLLSFLFHRVIPKEYQPEKNFQNIKLEA